MNCTEKDLNDRSHPCYQAALNNPDNWVSYGASTTTQTQKNMSDINIGLSNQQNYSSPTSSNIGVVNVGLGSTSFSNRSFTDIISSGQNSSIGLSGKEAVTNRNLGEVVEQGQNSKIGLLDANGNVKSSVLSMPVFDFDLKSSLNIFKTTEQKYNSPIDFAAIRNEAAQKSPTQQTFWDKNGRTILIILGVILSVAVVWHFLEDDKPAPARESEVLLDLRKLKK